MASARSIAIRQAQAMSDIVKLLGIEMPSAKNPDVQQALVLEAIAEGLAAKEKAHVAALEAAQAPADPDPDPEPETKPKGKGK